METSAEKLVLWKNDPLLYFFKTRLGFSGLRTTLLLTLITAAVFLGLGWIADNSYTGGGVRFTEPEFFYFALVWVFIITPLSVGFYVWQPGAFRNALDSFEKGGVIEAASEEDEKEEKSYPDFLDEFRMAVDRKTWSVIVTIFILGFWALEFLIVLPSLFKTYGRPTFWYDVKWFLVVVLLIFSVWLYIACMAFLKEIQAILYFNHLFQWFKVRIRPLHPDEAGGLGALGNLTLKTSLAAVGIGVIAAILHFVELITGGDPFARADYLLFWVMYILSVPTSLILPMLSAHGAMQEARNEKLKEISQEFEKTLSGATLTKTNDAEAIKKANEKLKELQTLYNIVAASFPTWPVPARLFRNFSITASLPMVSGLISMAIKFTT